MVEKSEAIPQKLRSVERSTIAIAIGAACFCYAIVARSLNVGAN